MVMRMKGNFTRKIATGLNVPSETLSHIPLGTFRGREQLSIENHCGVKVYTSDLIRIGVKGGAVVVHGTQLTITHMSRHGITLRGVIQTIELE